MTDMQFRHASLSVRIQKVHELRHFENTGKLAPFRWRFGYGLVWLYVNDKSKVIQVLVCFPLTTLAFFSTFMDEPVFTLKV